MRRSRLARRGGFALLAALMVGGLAAAQSGPSLDGNLYRKTSFNSEDEARIASFVAHWTARLNPPANSTDRLRNIQEAMRSLGTSVFNNPSVTPVFRTTYGRALVPALQPLVNSEDDAAAIRALYLLGRLGTDRAVEIVVAQIDNTSPIRRNAAAAAAKSAVREMTRSTPPLIGPATINTLLRITARQAAVESSPAALQRQLELLDQIHTSSLALTQDLPSLTNDAQARRIEVLGQCAEHLNTDVIEVDAIDMFVRNLRSTFLASTATQRRDGPALAVHLGRLLAAANDALKSIESGSTPPGGLHAAYSRLISDSESFLKLIDQTVRAGATPPTPNTRLKDHWDQRNLAQFEQDLRKWTEILNVAPYRR